MGLFFKGPMAYTQQLAIPEKKKNVLWLNLSLRMVNSRGIDNPVVGFTEVLAVSEIRVSHLNIGFQFKS